MSLFCAVTISIITVIIYLLLVTYVNNGKTPISYMENKTFNNTFNNTLEMYIFISVFLAFYTNKILINGCY